MWRLCLALKEHSAHRRSEEEEEAQRVAKITGNSIEKKFSFSFFFVFFFFIFILFSFSNLCETMRTCRRNVCKRCGNRMPDKYTTYNGKRWTKKKKKNNDERMKMTEYKIEQTHRVVQNRWDCVSYRLSCTYVLCAAFISVCHFGCDARRHTNLDPFQALAASAVSSRCVFGDMKSIQQCIMPAVCSGRQPHSSNTHTHTWMLIVIV